MFSHLRDIYTIYNTYVRARLAVSTRKKERSERDKIPYYWRTYNVGSTWIVSETQQISKPSPQNCPANKYIKLANTYITYKPRVVMSHRSHGDRQKLPSALLYKPLAIGSYNTLDLT